MLSISHVRTCNKRGQRQTLMTHFTTMKQRTTPYEPEAESMELCEQSDGYTPELAHAGSASHIEVEIPEAQNMDEFPDPMPKMETSNHKMNTCWFVEFSWLKLGGNNKSL